MPSSIQPALPDSPRPEMRFTNDELRDPLALLGGLPFLDQEFRPRRLLAGVAAARHREAQQLGKDSLSPEAWLAPSAIYMLRDSPVMPAEPLTPTRRASIQDQLADASTLMPEWAYLLELPVRYARLFPAHGAISASSRNWQQHVLLADAAFASGAELAEQLHHELAHQWLYLIQELWRLEEPHAPPTTLPSGTRDRSPSEVLGAAHVAAVLIHRYRRVGGASPQRLADLAAYGTGCLDRVDHLTAAGSRIAEHLARHLNRPSGGRPVRQTPDHACDHDATNRTAVPAPPPQAIPRPVLQMWRTPIYQADCPSASEHLPALRELILEAETTDSQAANFGGIDAIKSSQTMLTWQHPSIDWLKIQISAAASALAADVLGDAASEITGHGIDAEAWAVVYRSGGSLRPHTHHDSAWSGVLYVCADTGSDEDEAGYLQMLDPRPAAVGSEASSGVVRFQPVPGRMIAFPGWQPHSVRATASDSNLRIAIAWNVAYHEIFRGMS